MSTTAVIDPVPPLLDRIKLCIRTWITKSIISAVFGVSQFLKPSLFRKYRPTYVKSYPVRPTLECRVFVPNSYEPGSSLPLYIDIHGGAFFALTPTVDDKYCHTICNRFNYVVVSIEYRLAPSYPFPIPVDDCIELALAVIGDSELPFDQNKIVIGGQSAGGNLALAASQDPRLLPRLQAIVAFYPPVDFSHVFPGPFRDKPADANGKGAESDVIRPLVPLVEWAYPPFGQDRTDPRMSPIYANQASLPKRIYFITAQYDKLTQEAFSMACKLAMKDDKDESQGWDKNGIRWERLSNEVHGFIEAGWRWELFGKPDLVWKKEVDDVINRVGGWLEEILA